MTKKEQLKEAQAKIDAKNKELEELAAEQQIREDKAILRFKKVLDAK